MKTIFDRYLDAKDDLLDIQEAERVLKKRKKAAKQDVVEEREELLKECASSSPVEYSVDYMPGYSDRSTRSLTTLPFCKLRLRRAWKSRYNYEIPLDIREKLEPAIRERYDLGRAYADIVRQIQRWQTKFLELCPPEYRHHYFDLDDDKIRRFLYREEED